MPRRGAIRTYSNDEGWYEYFERLAGRAACIVMLVSDSNNLQRELTFIRREGLQRRLIIFTNLMETKLGPPPWGTLRALGWILARLYGPPPSGIGGGLATWEHFAENLEKLGFELGDDPGHGAVVTFDLGNKAVVLVRGAKRPLSHADIPPPSNFVEPIREYLVKTLGLDLPVLKDESGWVWLIVFGFLLLFLLAYFVIQIVRGIWGSPIVNLGMLSFELDDFGAPLLAAIVSAVLFALILSCGGLLSWWRRRQKIA